MFGNPQRYKVALQQYETRHANAGVYIILFSVNKVYFVNTSYYKTSTGSLHR